ncbi:MAG: phenylalanine--tRNA ligase subunit beta [bacterium]
MPVVGIPVERLARLVGRAVPREELQHALEQLGNDVEGYARVTRHACGRCGGVVELMEHEELPAACPSCGAAASLGAVGTDEVIRIALLPVRPDLYDVAGLARALRGWFGVETGLPAWPVTQSGFRVDVAAGMAEVRPYIVAAVVRRLAFDDETVRMVMKMQENLHWALGRDRRRASIGVYDLATVRPPFRFRPVGPDELRFAPLFGLPDDPRARLTPREVLEKHPKGQAYAHLLAGLARYPLLEDADGRVLSMPPIINSDETRVTRATKDCLIDVTGPDQPALDACLAVLVTALAELGGRIESVAVRYPGGEDVATPDLSPRPRTLDPAACARVTGLALSAEETARALERMRYGARAEDGTVRLDVPAHRSDVMHDCDVFEDVAIGRGYERIRPRLVPTMTASRPLAREELAARARRVLTGLGLFEVMTLVLTNACEQFELLGVPEPAHPAVANPLNVEQAMPRAHLLTGLLATFRGNVTREMPQRVFEVGECFELDPRAETGCRTMLRVAAGVAGPRAGFAEVRALAAALARELCAEPEFEAAEHPAYIPGRCARILLPRAGQRGPAGTVGEIHPQVLENFGLGQPVAVFELDLSLLEVNDA